MKNSSNKVTNLTILTVIGVGIMILAYFAWAYEHNFRKNAKISGAEIVSIDKKLTRSLRTEGIVDSYYPVFTFSAPETGENYTITGHRETMYLRVGDSVKVLYDPTNPNNAKLKMSVGFQDYLMAGFLFVLGAIITFTGVFGFVRRSVTHTLDERGKRVEATIVRVEVLKWPGGDKKDLGNPYIVYAVWENSETKKSFEFKSELLTSDFVHPTLFVEGDKVAVLIDVEDPSKYNFDIYSEDYKKMAA